MGRATLVIMAAGIGSRFGGGIKQLEPVGPNGEIIMDYSIYDAIEAGFDKVVFVIRKDLEKDFKKIIGKRIEKKIEVAYAFQETSDIPHKFREKFPDRKKPWGTGQAVLCCKEFVNEPFLVINADDYYGKEAYKAAYNYLTDEKKEPGNEKIHVCMIGFRLRNTLSDNGGVTRGVCHVRADGILEDIEETHNIERAGDHAVVKGKDGERYIDLDSNVSMNMWGMEPEFFDILESGFSEFLEGIEQGDSSKEYLLPTIVGDLLKEDKIEVQVLNSEDQWFGVTYKEDKEIVINSVKALVEKGLY